MCPGFKLFCFVNMFQVQSWDNLVEKHCITISRPEIESWLPYGPWAHDLTSLILSILILERGTMHNAIPPSGSSGGLEVMPGQRTRDTQQALISRNCYHHQTVNA